MNSEILYFVVKIISGGLICFFAILLLSKNRDSEWMCLVISCLCEYFFTVIELLIQYSLLQFNYPIIETIFKTAKTIIPSIFVILAFIIKLIKSKRI